MRIEYVNEFIQHMKLGDPTLCVYQFIFDQYGSNDTNNTQYFIINGMVL